MCVDCLQLASNMNDRFSHETLESISIKSQWRSEVARSSNFCQTDNWKVEEISTQLPIVRDNETQTNDSNEKGESSLPLNINFYQLNKFLSKCLPLVQSEIHDSVQFEQMTSSWLNYWDGLRSQGIKLERLLTSKYYDELITEIKENPNDQIISGVTWNRPGTSLTVTYQVKSHSNWCTHKTFLLTWNLFSHRDHLQRPYYSCEVDCCVKSIQAHPIQGSLYALGLASGGLIVIDTRQLSPELVTDLPISHVSITRGDLHQDSVINLHWNITKNARDNQNLISFSLDGLIIRWSLDDRSKSLQPLELFNILLTDLPKSMGLKEIIKGEEIPCVPILSASFEPDDETSFVIGCEAGALFRCSLNGNQREELKDQPQNWLIPKNPIVMAYAPHRAHVTTISFSPNLRNIFMSSGNDNELRIWDVFQSKPLFVVHCEVNILSSAWLFQRPGLICVQSDGFICIYSASSSIKPKLINRFSLEDRRVARSVWNNWLARSDQFALIDEDNQIHLYNIQLANDNLISDGNQ